jgi:hypothetical protein
MPTGNHPPIMKSNTKTHLKTVYRIIGFLYAATSRLKRVTGRILTISKCFHRSNPKLYLLFLHNKAAKNLTTSRSYTKSTDLIFETFKYHNKLFKHLKNISAHMQKVFFYCLDLPFPKAVYLTGTVWPDWIYMRVVSMDTNIG